ncbi:MAG: SAM-dependent methyltransferase [Lentimonas sp.]
MKKNQNTDNTADACYDQRHSKRNQSRVETIIEHCVTGERALDIGCNAGYFSEALLSRSVVNKVDAIEFDANTVNPHLKNNSDFCLFEGDATNFKFKHRYDIVVYGAVHHHILGHHGFNAATTFWNELVDHTESLIFLETGQIGEGSRWYWQRALRSLYNSDERYIGELLSAIGPRFKSAALIGRYRIHGVRRWLLKIELWPRDRVSPSQTNQLEQLNNEQLFWRTIGSSRQQLIPDADKKKHQIFEGVEFRTGETTDGRKVFCKKYIAHKKQLSEYSIGNQVKDDPRFITADSISRRYGLVFPFTEGVTLSQKMPTEISAPKELKRQLLSLYEYAKHKTITLDFSGAHTFKLIDVIDMHPANLFLQPKTDNLLVLDLEFYSTKNGSRNRYNIMRAILRHGPISLFSTISYLLAATAYFLDLIRFSFLPATVRIQSRVDNIFYRPYVALRELIDRAAKNIIPGYWQ